MRSASVILFLALIALIYAKSYEDIKEEIKKEVEKEILDDLDEESDELEDNGREVNDPRARRWRRIRFRKIVPYIPVIIKASQAGKK
uniref:Arminin 1470 n=1 Tax=Hydra oligactis TaxID=6088 RepID=R9UCX3_HYDOL|nr:arminin 1470 [Hydra oligactis]